MKMNKFLSLSSILLFINFAQSQSGKFYEFYPDSKNPSSIIDGIEEYRRWNFFTTENYTVYTNDGKHSFEDFIKPNEFEIINSSSFENGVGYYMGFDYEYFFQFRLIDDITHEFPYFGIVKNLIINDSTITFSSFISYKNDNEKIRTNNMSVRFNYNTKKLELLYVLENETYSITKLEEYQIDSFESYIIEDKLKKCKKKPFWNR